MTLEERNYYEDVLALFNTPGWKYLSEDLAKQRASYSDINRSTTLEDLYFNKGVVNNLDYLLNLKETFEQAYQQLQEADDAQSQ